MEQPRVVRLGVTVGVPVAAAVIIAGGVTLVTGWSMRDGIGLAIGVFALTLIPWMGFLVVRKIRREEME